MCMLLHPQSINVVIHIFNSHYFTSSMSLCGIPVLLCLIPLICLTLIYILSFFLYLSYLNDLAAPMTHFPNRNH